MSTPRDVGRAAIPALLLAVFAGLAVASLRDEAPTIDEVQHLAAGYSYLRTGDFRFGPEHPPLMKMLAAAPLLFLGLKPVADVPGWQTNDRATFDRDFLLHNWASPWRMLFVARMPMVAVGVLTGLLVFAWAGELWGYWPGVFVLFLYTFCPNVLAHTRLVTTDGGAMTFTVLTLFALWRYRRSGRLLWAATCGLALGCALLAKYSTGVTALLVVALLFVPLNVGATPTPSVRPIRALVTIGTVAVITITLGYASPFGLVQYAHGFEALRVAWRPGARTKWSFLWGQHSRTGFWDYYLLAQLWKTPIPTLVFFVWALAVLARQRARWGDAAFLCAPIVAYHGAGPLSEVNIGLRHLLPVFPFLFLVCGAVAWHLRPRHTTAAIVFAILCVWYVAGTLSAFPHFIAYFNDLVGGPDNGIHYLDDSNIDWGQDVLRLQRYLEDHRVGRIRFAAFAPFTPAEYGIDAEPIGLRDLVWPQPGVTYAVSADYLQRRTLYRDNTALRFDWLQRYRPVEKVGWSIFIYRFSVDPADVNDARTVYIPRAQWLAHARATLDDIRVQSPELTEVRNLKAEVQAQERASDGKTDE